MVSMMLLNIKTKTFAPDYLITEGQNQYWFEVNQDEINEISASITNGGDVWVENGKIHCSGKAPSEFHIFDKEKKQFVISKEKQAELLIKQRAEIRAQINAKRDECVNGGVFVPEINKWVDTDDKGRSTLVEIKADFDLNGKNNTYTLICADNTAQVIHFEEFKAVWNAVKTLKEKMYENAYMHKVLLEQSENPKKQKTKINFTNPFKKSKDKKTKKKRTWVKVLTNLFLLAIMLLCSFAIFAVNGFNMVADKEYLARVEELQNLSEKSNGLTNLTPDYMFIQFFSKNSNTIMLFSVILLIVVTLLVFILNITVFKRKRYKK